MNLPHALQSTISVQPRVDYPPNGAHSPLSTGHFHFARNRTFSFCIDIKKEACENYLFV
jgi:hypothetical protein